MLNTIQCILILLLGLLSIISNKYSGGDEITEKFAAMKQRCKDYEYKELSDPRVCSPCPYQYRQYTDKPSTPVECQELEFKCADKKRLIDGKTRIVLENNIFIIPPEGEVTFGGTVTSCTVGCITLDNGFKVAFHFNLSQTVFDQYVGSRKNIINIHNIIPKLKEKLNEIQKLRMDIPIKVKTFVIFTEEDFPSIGTLNKQINHPWHDAGFNLLPSDYYGFFTKEFFEENYNVKEDDYLSVSTVSHNNAETKKFCEELFQLLGLEKNFSFHFYIWIKMQIKSKEKCLYIKSDGIPVLKNINEQTGEPVGSGIPPTYTQYLHIT